MPDEAESALESSWRAEAVAFAPELAIAEAAQVLLKKVRAGGLAEHEADEILAGILDLPIEWIGHRESIVSATHLARKHDLTVYDGLYLALARERQATLVTADRRLAAARAAEQ